MKQLHIKQEHGSPAVRLLSLRCPACKQIGVFQQFGTDMGFIDAPPKLPSTDTLIATTTGQRKCPNPECAAHVFIVVKSGQIQITYPPQRINFDTSSLPALIVEAFEEAITCHSTQCFVAAAIMVRKTLDLLCEAQSATGGNLKLKLQSLGSKVVLPPDLINGLDDVRLLGNDAAHVDSQAYIKVSQDEVEIAIEFTKEVLKAIYQYSGLLARLRSLKQPPNPPSA